MPFVWLRSSTSRFSITEDILGYDMQSNEKFVLVGTAKNEGPYIFEWVAHHLASGFTDIIIFQNDSDDYTDQILKCLRKYGIVNYKYNKAKKGAHQVRAYKRSSRLPEYLAADWVMALDLDEFLNIKVGDNTLPSLMRAIPSADQIFINWVKFGHNGHKNIGEDLVVNRFTRTENTQRITQGFEPFKTLFRRSVFRRPGIHKPQNPIIPETEIRTKNGSGLDSNEFETRNFQCTDPNLRNFAQVNHYIVRDVSSFVIKAYKGSAHQANRPIDMKYWKNRNRNQQEDKSLAFRSSKILKKMIELDTITGGELERLRKMAIKNHNSKIVSILKEPNYQELYSFCVSVDGGMPLN